jgi:type I restriction enzyme S subunit
MGVIGFKSKLSDLKSDQYLRCDTDFLEFNKTVGTANRYLKNFVPVFETGKPITKQDYSENGVTTEYIHLVVRNIKNGVLNLDDPIYINEEKGEALKQFKIESGDIVVAISANCGSAFYFNEVIKDYQLTLSHYLSKFKVNPDNLNPRLLVYYLNSKTIQKYFRATETGKTQKNLSKTYLRELPIFLPADVEQQNEILNSITPIENEISELKRQVVKPIEIINQVFGEAFGFDWEEFEKLSREKVYKISFSKLKESIDFRTATKFHSIKYDFLKLPVFNEHKFKDFSDFMTLGRQITPSDYEEESEYFYLMPNSIKTFHLEEDLLKPISESFYNRFQHISLKYGDLLLAASGEGTIGKAAIYNSEKDAVTSQFIMKIELNDKSLIDYFHYYMQSSYFQLTVEKFKKGMGNMTNIFVSQVKDFPILYNKNKVNEIVELIKSQLVEQKKIDRQIEEKQQAINKIIEDAIQQEQD